MENNNYVLEEDINLGTVKIADDGFFFNLNSHCNDLLLFSFYALL